MKNNYESFSLYWCEELTYRDEKDQQSKWRKYFKVHAQEFVDLICMLTMVKMKEESP